MPHKDDDLLEHLKREASQAVGAHDGQIAEDLEKLNDYYHGRPYGNEVKGRSQFVTREVYEVVESLMPYLVKIFFSADKAAIFDPADEEDLEISEQETEYVNWVFYKDNPGFEIGYTWLKDGLMNRVGYVKVSRESPEPTVTEYKNKTQEELALMYEELPETFEGDVRVEQTGPDAFDVTVTEITGRNRTVIQNIPPEEFRISERDIDPDEAVYVAQHTLRTISEIRAMGFEIDDDVEDTRDEIDTSLLKTDRFEDIDGIIEADEAERTGPSREVMLKEEYIRVDRDDDGVNELWQVFRVGDTILGEERVPESPFCYWTPIIVPHRHHGMTPADSVMDIQLLKSKVTRNLLDNQERIINGRYAVVDGQVNLDDLMSSDPLGIVREEFSGAVRDLPTPALDRSSFDVLQVADSWAERRSGVSERGQGLDPRMFNSNTAASTAELVMTNAEQKAELIARIFAETGLKRMLLKIQRLGLTHEEPGMKIMTSSGEFHPINPESWRTRRDMTITVGIGNGSQNQQLLQMQMIEQTIQSIVGAGGLGTIIKPSNVWNFAMEKTRVAGRKDGSKFFSRPESDEVEQGPSLEEQAKAQEVQIKQMEAQVEAQKVEVEQARLLLEERKIALEEKLASLKERIHEDNNEFKLAELALEKEQQRAVKVGGDS